MTQLSSAKSRGWGDPGGPAVPKVAAAFRERNIITVSAGNIRLAVHKSIAPLVREGIRKCLAIGYTFDRVADDWGYANRYIRGAEARRVLSNHAWGLALDLNATKNPMTSDGKLHTDMPATVVAIWTSLGFMWGGNYSGARKDTMHYEFAGTPATAAALVKSLNLS
jgi:hypothetical protein